MNESVEAPLSEARKVLIKPIRIRNCSSCGKELCDENGRCPDCQKKKEAKPRFKEYFDYPKAERICDCQLVAYFRCQNPVCGKIFKRYLKERAKERMTPFKDLFCSPGCVLVVSNASKKVLVKIKCGYESCGKEFDRPKWKIKQSLSGKYFHTLECFKLWQKQQKAQKQEDVRAAKVQETDSAYLVCQNGCAGEYGDKITRHIFLKSSVRKSASSSSQYKCEECGHQRTATDNTRIEKYERKGNS